MSQFKEEATVKRPIIRRWFVGGLLFWVPLLVCIWVITSIVQFLDESILLLPFAYQPKQLFGFNIPGIGVVLTILVLIVTGFVISNFIGNYFLRIWERILTNIPLVRSIYTSVKQILETFTSPSGTAFKKVLLIEFPRAGSWSLAFQTTKSVDMINNKLEQETVNVFVPTTPNITSGFLMVLPIEETKEVDMSIEEALKMIVSLGMVQKKQVKD